MIIFCVSNSTCRNFLPKTFTWESLHKAVLSNCIPNSFQLPTNNCNNIGVRASQITIVKKIRISLVCKYGFPICEILTSDQQTGSLKTNALD